MLPAAGRGLVHAVNRPPAGPEGRLNLSLIVEVKHFSGAEIGRTPPERAGEGLPAGIAAGRKVHAPDDFCLRVLFENERLSGKAVLAGRKAISGGDGTPPPGGEGGSSFSFIRSVSFLLCRHLFPYFNAYSSTCLFRL